MEHQAITSSLIKSIGYDPEKNILEIEFIRNVRQDVRTVYQYPDFSQKDFDALMGVGKPEGEKHSIGSHFLKNIKKRYDGKFVKREEPLEAKKAEAPKEKAAE
jgi:hypothetical protein